MTGLEIIVVLLLILGAGFFAMAEFSVVSSRRNRLGQLAARGHRGAQAAIELADQLVRFLAAVQVGTTLSTMLVGALTGAVLAARLAGSVGEYTVTAPFGTLAAMIIVIAASTYVSLILGEMLPKQIALKYPEAIASRIAPTLAVLGRGGIVLFVRSRRRNPGDVRAIAHALGQCESRSAALCLLP
jgi:putative hemolysin